MRPSRPFLLAPGNALPHTDAESDESLVARLLGGDGSALGLLFRAHAPSLLRLARSLTGSAADAEDVVQDVFVGLALALRRYQERGTFAAWLRGVTIRTALANQRRATRRNEAPADPSNMAKTNVASAEQRVVVEDAVRRLPDDMRVVFVLKVVEGYSHEEIGELLGINTGTSQVRLFRAVRRLRSILAESP